MLGVAMLALLGIVVPARSAVAVEDSVVGTAQVGNPFSGASATIDAHSGPSGENPTGTVNITAHANRLAGPVTCLNVTGNRATIGIANADRPGEGGIIYVEDGGPGGTDALDFGAVASPPTSCLVNPAILPPIISGDIQVTDASPSPTTKQQCKDGGYASFGFSNQGRCVAFVESGRR
jgi:hypothetical protein